MRGSLPSFLVLAALTAFTGCAGITPLHRAADRGDVAEIERLLAQGANVEVKDAAHQTPMVYAAASGSVDALRALVARGASVKEIALYFAAAGGHLEAVRYLLSKNCNPEWKWVSGKTSLQMAEEKGHREVVALMRKTIADRAAGVRPVALDPAVEKLPALFRASEAGEADVVRRELARPGVSLDALDAQGLTALSRAAFQGHVEVAKLLLDAGASPDARNGNKATALHYAAAGGKTATLELLLARGVPVDAPDSQGATPLRWAAYNGKQEAAEMLLARGADANAAQTDGATPLHGAAVGNQAALIDLLVRYGAKVETADDAGGTPAMTAVLAQKWDAVDALRRHGAAIPEDLGKVGLGLGLKDGVLNVIQVDSAALRAGIAVGDQLVELEGAPTAGMSVPQAISRIRGPAGGTVRLSIRRGERVIPFVIVRDTLMPAERRKGPAPVAAAPAPAPSPVQAPAQPRGPTPSPAPKDWRAPDEGRFALVVGIEHYDSLPSASYAARDAKAVRAHFEALGVPPRNLIYLENAKAGRSSLEKYLSEWLPRNVKEGGEVYFYFSGHGAPDPVSGEAYLVPWDGDPSFLKSTALPLKDLYAALGRLKAKRVVVALDACFSGAGGRSVLAKGARPLVARTQAVEAPEKLTVLAASSGEEISGALEERGHGMFTYFFLKGLSEGKRSSRELYDYLKPRVQDEARRQNREQTPMLLGAEAEL